jgi:hypothetical protein
VEGCEIWGQVGRDILEYRAIVEEKVHLALAIVGAAVSGNTFTVRVAHQKHRKIYRNTWSARRSAYIYSNLSHSPIRPYQYNSAYPVFTVTTAWYHGPLLRPRNLDAGDRRRGLHSYDREGSNESQRIFILREIS